MFDWVVGVWLKFWNLALTLFQVYKLSRENIQPENICDIVFEKTNGGTVNRTSVHAEAAVHRFL